ncbi:cyclopropane-fatty-acyl-phospholipid synthase family protein [Xanthomonas campestris pv. fici]|uniref:SAM-dependent methyltransferase n=1 Tax=Xanthomonas euvesicatoria TaxID=456327 RepID=UPI00355791F2
MIDKTEIRPGQRFVDLGCGPGLAAIELAEARGCEVDGITISQVQQRSAIESARHAASTTASASSMAQRWRCRARTSATTAAGSSSRSSTWGNAQRCGRPTGSLSRARC